MQIIRSGKRQITVGIELPNQERISTLGEKGNNKHFGILEADTIKQVEIKATFQKKNPRGMRKFFETKLCCRNLVKGINV